MAVRTDVKDEYGWNHTITYDRNGVITGDTSLAVVSGGESFEIKTDGMTLHKNRPTGFYYEKTITSHVHGELKTFRDPTWWPIYLSSEKYYDYYSPITRFTPPDSTEMEARVGQKAVLNFWDAVADTDLNIAQDLFEGKQTTQLISTALRTLKDVKKNFKKLVIDAGKNPADTASKAWLSYVYGIKPTMQTIHGLATQEARALDSKIKIRSGSAETITAKNEVDDYKTLKASVSHRVSYGCVVRVPESDDLNRLTSLDPAVIVYELTPYSFVLDWFINIGGTLAAMETRRRYMSYCSNCYSTTTRKTVKTDTRVKSDYLVPPGGTDSTYGLSGEETFISLNRVVLSSPPSVRFPRFNIPKFGYSRIASAAALIYQAAKR